MNSVTLQCSICLNEVKINNDKLNDEPFYVVPMAKLRLCGHVFCIGCLKNMQFERFAEVKCAVCRKINRQLDTLIIDSSNKVFTLMLRLNTIKKEPSLDNVVNNVASVIKTYYSYGVLNNDASTSSEPSPSQSSLSAPTRPLSPTLAEPSSSSSSSRSNINDDDIENRRLESVMELSRIQLQIENLNKNNNEALELQASLKKRNDEYLKLKESLKNDVEKLKTQIDENKIELSKLQMKDEEIKKSVKKQRATLCELQQNVKKIRVNNQKGIKFFFNKKIIKNIKTETINVTDIKTETIDLTDSETNDHIKEPETVDSIEIKKPETVKTKESETVVDDNTKNKLCAEDRKRKLGCYCLYTDLFGCMSSSSSCPTSSNNVAAKKPKHDFNI